MNRGRTPNSAK